MGDPAVRLGHVLLGPACSGPLPPSNARAGDEVVAGRTGCVEHWPDGDASWSATGAVGGPAGLRRRASPLRAAAARRPSTRAQHAPGWRPSSIPPSPSGCGRDGASSSTSTGRSRPCSSACRRCPLDDREAVAALQRFLAAAVRRDRALRRPLPPPRHRRERAACSWPSSARRSATRTTRSAPSAAAWSCSRLPGGPYRAGVAPERCTAARSGPDARREYAVIGDSVNLAARLMQAAETGSSSSIARRTSGSGDTPSTTGSRRSPSRARRAGSTSGRCGRCGSSAPWRPSRRSTCRSWAATAEVARIGAAVGRVQNGEGHVLVVTGDAGIGKSRLVAEVVRAATSARFHGRRRRLPVARHDHQLPGLALDLARSPASRHVAAGRRSSRRSSWTGSRGTPPDAAQRAPLLAPVLNVPMPDSALIAPLDPQTRDGLLRTLLLECLCDHRVVDADPARARGLPLDRPAPPPPCWSSSPAASATGAC